MVLVGVSLTWVFVFLTIFILMTNNVSTLPWLRDDEMGIGHAMTLIFAIIGLMFSKVSHDYSIKFFEKDPSTKFGVFLLYFNLFAVLFSIFGPPILLYFFP